MKSFESLLQFARPRIYGMVDVLHTMWVGYYSQNNVMLFGEGGYGKSDVARTFVDWLIHEGEIQKEEAFEMAFSIGTKADAPFGGINMKELTATGIITFNHDQGIQSHSVAILEEIGDAAPQILSTLKDMLSSGTVKGGHQSYPSKNKFIIATSNSDPDQIAGNETGLMALMQRFPLQARVHQIMDRDLYKEILYTKHIPNTEQEDQILQATLAVINMYNNAKNNKPSVVNPRMAIQLYMAMIRTNRIQSMRAFAWTGPYVNEIVKQFETSRFVEEITKLRVGIDVLIESHLQKIRVIENPNVGFYRFLTAIHLKRQMFAFIPENPTDGEMTALLDLDRVFLDQIEQAKKELTLLIANTESGFFKFVMNANATTLHSVVKNVHDETFCLMAEAYKIDVLPIPLDPIYRMTKGRLIPSS